MSRWKLFTAVAAIGAIGVLTAAQFAAAVQPGDTVSFLIPADANQPDPPSGPNDGLIYHGGAATTIDATGCESGNFPVQDATLVDPSGGQSGRIEGVITVSHPDPVPAGTRLVGLHEHPSSPCFVGTTEYRRWVGVVVVRR